MNKYFEKHNNNTKTQGVTDQSVTNNSSSNYEF